MDVVKSTEYQYMPFIVKELEDHVGGVSIALTDLRADVSAVPPGAFIGIDTDGKGHVLKSAALLAVAANNATTYRIGKTHQFKVGLFVTSKDKASVKAYAITAIDTTNADYDTITVGTTLGVALAIGDNLIEVKAEDAVGGAGELMYTPVGISKREIITTGSTASVGVLVRGTVNVANMAFGAPKAFKDSLPLVRFV
jgi:hypothetical protein